jgi:hypothetical protein
MEGIGGQISYAPRFPGYVCDDAKSDDILLVYFDPSIIDTGAFCRDALPQMIKIFHPYIARFETDQEVALEDWDVIQEQSQDFGRRLDGRHGVYRIWPVGFFDELLCQRAFGMYPAELVRRSEPECEFACVIDGGAFLIVTSELVTGQDALDELHERVLARIARR